MRLLLALLSLTLYSTLSSAASQRPPPLHPHALSHPDHISAHILSNPAHSNSPNSPAWDDHFLLSFVTHSLPITLSLKPSSTLVHPNGIKVTTTHTDPITGLRSEIVEWIGREKVRAYEGSVWVHSGNLLSDDDDHEGAQFEKWVREEQAGVLRSGAESQKLNWARVVLPGVSQVDQNQDQEDGLRFQGSFSIEGETYTIHPTSNYLATKHLLDPLPPLLTRRNGGGSSGYSNMVVVRERGTMSTEEHISELRRRGLDVPNPEELLGGDSVASRCGHDHLSFNSNPLHPIYSPSNQIPQPFFTAEDETTSFILSPYFNFLPIGQKARPSILKRQTVGGGDVAGATGNASSNFINSIGSTVGCPKSSMVLFVGVAADCTFVSQFASSDVARTQILTDFNSVSSLYSSSFNISIGIVELNVQSGSCPTSNSTVDPSNPWNVGCPEGGSPGLDLNDRLSVFSAWRGAKGGADGAGLWHLLTNCSTGSEVGVAWLGQLCKVAASSSGSSGTTSGTGVTAITRSTWQVVAHEIGHSFGAIHDCATGCTLVNSNPVCCPLTTTSCDASANFIMSPVSTKNVSSFSPCSIGNICTSLATSLNTTCLAKPGLIGNPTVISLKSCGNGIVEAGEDCDPGSDTNDPCCDAATCKFAAGAVCDPLNSLCCTTACQIASAGVVCRPSVDTACDFAESCSGNNSSCPADTFKKDATSCGSNGLACASGICTSRSLQCQTAGASLSLQASCPSRASDSCSISCQDPTSSADCIVLEQSFRDGSPCGYAGTCENSVCQAGSAIDVAKSWYVNNLNIAIPVTVVAGVIIILFIIGIVRCCFTRSKRRQNQKLASSSLYVPPMAANGRLRTRGSGNRRSQQLQRPPGNSAEPAIPPMGYDGGGRQASWGNGYEAPAYYPPPPANGGPWVPLGASSQTQAQNGGWVDPSAWNGPHQPR